MPRILILGGTAEARSLAERLAGRADLDVTLSLAGRTAAPVRAAGAGPHRRLRRRRRARGLSARERIDALIDATHPYASTISANAAAAARHSRRCRSSRCGGRPGREIDGDRWTEVERCQRRGRARLATHPRRVFVALGRNELAPFAAGAAASLSDPQRRSGRAAAAAAARDYITARGPFSEADDRALAASRIASTRSSPRTAAARRPTARSPRRARSASTSSCCAGRQLPDTPARRDGRRGDRLARS